MKVVVVTYGFDYEHVHTLGVYRSVYLANKAIKENKEELDTYHYVSKQVYLLGETYI